MSNKGLGQETGGAGRGKTRHDRAAIPRLSPAASRPLKVVYVIWSLELGGAEQVLMRLATGMKRRGHHATIVTLNAPGIYASAMASQGIDVIPMHKRGSYDVSVLWRLVSTLRRFQPDVVHTHLWNAGFWGRLAACLCRTMGAIRHGRQAWLARVPVIIAHEHGMQPWRGWFHFTCDRWLGSVTYRVLFASQQVLETYRARIGMAASKCMVIPNGVTLQPVVQDRSAFRRAHGWATGDRVIVSVGRLSPEKGYADLLQAFARVARQVPNARLVLIGDGQSHEELHELQRHIGLNGQVMFAGRQEDVASWLSAADLYVQPSHREGLPLAVLEAMAAGLPVVATRVGDLPRLITDGREGYLVPPAQPETLAAKLIDVAQHLQAQQPVVDAARRLVRARYSDEQMLNAIEAVYQDAMRRMRNAEFGVRDG